MSTTGHENIDRFYALAAHASLISDPAEIFRQSRALLLRMIPADYFLIFYDDKLRECLAASFAYNILPLPTIEEITIPYQDPLIKEVLISRQTVVRQDCMEPLVHDVSQELIIPIFTPEEVLGSLYFARLAERPFTAEEIRLAELCAFLLVAPMERAHWEQRSRQTHEILNSFREKYLSILDALPYPAMVIDPDADRLEEVNRAFLDWMGYDRRQIFLSRFSELCRSQGDFDNGKAWPPHSSRVQIVDPNGVLHEVQALSASLSTQEPGKRIITFISDWRPARQEGLQQDAEILIRTLAHDLKAPLQSLKGYATLLLEEQGSDLPAAASTYLERMSSNIEQMERLIADLLDLSRLNSGDFPFQEADSFEILKSALDSLSGLIEKRPVNLIIDSTLPRIVCNASQIAQVFTNLISNALKFTRGIAIPNIEVGCSATEEDFEFYVKDNGVGIAPEDLERIFDLFYTRDTGEGSKSTGVGLTIVKRIVERHHGRVWAESVPGVGTVIKFTLPQVLHRQATLAGE
ncbi:MAG TPA: GAF domain-containing sensor histidine kinase [bacterium]|nr:GAF domain-containing sensor histidine kinase [bacterium]HQG44557.1 GAF domain-containing sensor histidine kinase [bacterium]HQI48189.1 GAF domain-containing sensor histidine kinase [bacterium]HQJ64550.1 GAF domain-containing sensor histidine kinase [bacterium]